VTDEQRLIPALFDGERLRQARLYRGLRKQEVASLLNLTAASVGQYEQGKIRPSSSTLAKLALALGFPPQFFERGRPLGRMPADQAHFRSLRSTSKLDRDRLLVRLELLSEVVSHVEQHVRLPVCDLPTDLPPLLDGDQDAVIEDAAMNLRDRWELGRGPIDSVVRLVERHGVLVIRPTLGAPGVDAFSTAALARPMLVLSKDKDDAARSRFDATHELAHLLHHHDVEPGSAWVERQANRFAAAFLMPADALLKELPPRMSWPAYFQLKQRWRVSLAALLYRSKTLGRLSSDGYLRAQIFLRRQGWHLAEPVNIGVPEEPVLLFKALELMRTQLGVGIEQLASEICVPPEELRSLIADVLPGDAERPVVPV